MKLKRKKRLLAIIAIVIGVSAASGLLLYALKQNINLYLTPTQVASGDAPRKSTFRMGGMVVKGSVHRGVGLDIHFVLTDFKTRVKVVYDGVLPALFKEGQGIVAQGKLNAQGVFVAEQVLAKHDEKYKPPGIKMPEKTNSLGNK